LSGWRYALISMRFPLGSLIINFLSLWARPHTRELAAQQSADLHEDELRLTPTRPMKRSPRSVSSSALVPSRWPDRFEALLVRQRAGHRQSRPFSFQSQHRGGSGRSRLPHSDHGQESKDEKWDARKSFLRCVLSIYEHLTQTWGKDVGLERCPISSAASGELPGLILFGGRASSETPETK